MPLQRVVLLVFSGLLVLFVITLKTALLDEETPRQELKARAQAGGPSALSLATDSRLRSVQVEPSLNQPIAEMPQYLEMLLSDEIFELFQPQNQPTIARHNHDTCVRTRKRTGNYQLMSGATFRNFSTYLYESRLRCERLDPEDVEAGGLLFLESRESIVREFFAEVHLKIRNPYILIVHETDDGMPIDCHKFLDDPKTIAWFVSNPVGIKHPKLFYIPKGPSDSSIAMEWFKDMQELRKNRANPENRPYRLYVNLTPRKHAPERTMLVDKFEHESFALVSKTWISEEQYRQELASSMFVLSPRGDGLDCYRTWEAFLLGTIPIVKTSALDVLYKDLPVVIVQSWQEMIDEAWLMSKYNELRHKTFNMQKAFFPYWFNRIMTQQNRYLATISAR